ncbi:aldehyde dehydrogenase family protein [Klebsiella pneumoniae]|nr:aldehyde dehydrogenase family protein [Klebsiella pneumoniae]
MSRAAIGSPGRKYTAFTRRQPPGVVVGIVPWNFSITDCHLEAGGGLVCGCCRPQAERIYAAGRCCAWRSWQKRWVSRMGVNVVNGAGGVAQRLITHPACAKVSFTGSVATGEKSSSRPVRQVNG